jgi:hydroxymethylpyrimidine pyrophosphatase-like HAD family hydrolase
MRYRILACDYDGTLAHNGFVDAPTVSALESLRASGRDLVLVTGRELHDLQQTFPQIHLFAWIVAENGGLLYNPATREEIPLGPEPPQELVTLLRERGVVPLSVGKTLVATWEPHETVVLSAIRELGLELQVIFNKGAVMVLPAGVTKRTGLEAALARLESSAHNCVAVGDAENDHALLALCECAVAVANALPAVKASADWVTTGDHGSGVRELIARLLSDDLASLEPRLERHHVLLGTYDDGREATVIPYGTVGLVAGGSGAGKTTATTGIIERLAEGGYQVCIIDPEGDHDDFPGAVVAGTAEQPPEIEQVLKILARPANHAVVNLLAVPLAERPRFFLSLLGRLQEMRATTGRPHWIAVDEAHHVLDQAFQPALITLPSQLKSMLFVTVRPESLLESVLQQVDFLLTVGEHAETTLNAFAGALKKRVPRLESLPARPGEALLWRTAEGTARTLTLSAGKSSSRRHRRKYARGELGPDKSFYFRGADGRLNLRAQNLMVFNDIGAGVDDATWSYHLAQGHYSEWMRTAIKDDALADGVARIEADGTLDAVQSRARIRELIEQSYTAPA